MGNVEKELMNLLQDIVELFQSRKRAKKISKRIQRGRAQSIASEFEDRFARFLEMVLPEKYSILVDYPLSYEIDGRKRRKTSYPDIAIVRDGQMLEGIIELKIDLGYLRRDWIKESKAEFTYLQKAHKVKYKTDVGTDKAEQREFTVSRNFHRAIVVVTGKNDHGRLEVFRRQENCYVLSSNIHPNDYTIHYSNKGDFVRRIGSHKENRKDWKALAEFLNGCFRP